MLYRTEQNFVLLKIYSIVVTNPYQEGSVTCKFINFSLWDCLSGWALWTMSICGECVCLFVPA